MLQKTALTLKQAMAASYDLEELKRITPAVLKNLNNICLQGLAIIQTEDIPDEATLLWFSNFDSSESSFLKVWSKSKQNIFSPWIEVPHPLKPPVPGAAAQFKTLTDKGHQQYLVVVMQAST